MRKLTISLSLISALFMFSLTTYADSNDHEITFKDDTTISLKDSSSSDHTVLDSNGKIIYEGKGTDVSLSNDSDLNYYSIVQNDGVNQKIYNVL